MKRLTLVITLFILSVSNAQETSTYEKDTYVLVELLCKSTFNSLVEHFSVYVKKENTEKFKEEVKSTFSELYTALTEVYKEKYTHLEVKELLAANKTDSAIRATNENIKLPEQGEVIAHDWGLKLQDIMAKYQ